MGLRLVTLEVSDEDIGGLIRTKKTKDVIPLGS